MVRSFFEAPRTIYLNRALQSDPARLKFDLASHIAHKVLHGGDGVEVARTRPAARWAAAPRAAPRVAAGMNAQDVLHAWRDFECSFFAGALLAPKVPFRRFLARERYRVEAGEKLELTPAVVMRRMTKVSPYPYWHFFDAYPPGYLRAVYRGNGIPLPWGNMAQVTDPCPNWAVFRMLDEPQHGAAARRSRCCATASGRCSTAATRCAARHGRQPARAVGGHRSRRRWTRTASPARAVIASPSHDDPRNACTTAGRRRSQKRRGACARRGRQRAQHRLGRGCAAHPARIICPRSSRCPRAGRATARPRNARARSVTCDAKSSDQ